MNTKMDGIKIKIGLIICQTKMKYENSKNSYKVENSTKMLFPVHFAAK